MRLQFIDLHVVVVLAMCTLIACMWISLGNYMLVSLGILFLIPQGIIIFGLDNCSTRAEMVSHLLTNEAVVALFMAIYLIAFWAFRG